MRILVEQSGYPLANFGDVAMLQVAICRLIQLWPDASIEVFTSAPDRLRKFCPGAKPLTINGHNIWFYPLIGRLHALLPSSLAEFWTDWEWKLRQYSPSTVRALLNLKTKPHALDYHALQMFTKALYRADLVVATGGGYINDEFPELASGILGVLGVASRLGKPTVMLGQGLGPLENPRLRTQAKQVFPRLNLMALRENYAGKKLLNSLGVAPKTLITTGDDAIESAYNKHHSNIGNAIGVNLRVASYSGVNTQIIETVRQAVQSSAKMKSCRLVSIPISEYDADIKTNQLLLHDFENTLNIEESIDTPEQVIQLVSYCRVVVTGSYHAGVFALAQGIPIISLAKSQYYIDKFVGLAGQFGTACEMLLLDDPQLQEKLINTIVRSWESAEALREKLLGVAKRQIRISQNAYQRIFKLI